MSSLDFTHDPARKSWVISANGHREFPIQNLPLGAFSNEGENRIRAGVAIGDEILDLSAASEAGLLGPEAALVAESVSSGRGLNAFLALGLGPRQALREQLSKSLSANASDQTTLSKFLHRSSDCVLRMPMSIGDYTDFYVGIHHATNVGKLYRPDNPLMPNYKWLPIGYHGRSSTVVPTGVPVRRPNGQSKKDNDPAPSFGPCGTLDYELEIGIWIGTGNEQGQPIPISNAPDHIAGYCLLNDWSARDLQKWEYQPLGPFLSKNFATTISTWVITPEALAPFRTAQPLRPAQDPAPLDYLYDSRDQSTGAFAIELEVLLLTERMRNQGLAPHRLSLGNTRDMYWTSAQLVAQHTCNGCSLRPGDLFGSGTISAPSKEGYGSLLEISRGGTEPIILPSGETRTFLVDGDEVIIRAQARHGDAVPIGFGSCRAVVLPARPYPNADGASS